MKISRLLIIIEIFTVSNFVNAQTQEKQSLSEFINGETLKYSTNGLEKSKGLKLHIKYPSSWKSMEGEHPHVLRKFAQPDNYAISMVLVNRLDKPLTVDEINEFFTTEGLKSIVPEGSNVYSIDTNLKIEKLQACSIDFLTSGVRMERTINSFNRFYMIVFKDYFIMIQFMVVNKNDESKESLFNRFNILKPLFYQIFNSIVIENIWE